MNSSAFFAMTGMTPAQAHHKLTLEQRERDMPQVNALLDAGWKFELPEIVNGWPHRETEPMSWYWRSPPRCRGSKGRKYWSTQQAFNALRK